jgi:hypothetical protein
MLAVTAYSSQLLYWTAVLSPEGVLGWQLARLWQLIFHSCCIEQLSCLQKESLDGNWPDCDSLFFTAAVLNSCLVSKWSLGWQLCWLGQLILPSCCIEQLSCLQQESLDGNCAGCDSFFFTAAVLNSCLVSRRSPWMATGLTVTAYSSQLLYCTAALSPNGVLDGSCAGWDSLFFTAAVLNSCPVCRWILGWQLCWLWQLILHSCCIEQLFFLQVDPGMATVLAVTAYSSQLLYWTAVFSAGGSWDGSCAGCDSLFFTAAVLNSCFFLQVDPGMAAVLALAVSGSGSNSCFHLQSSQHCHRQVP